PLVEEARRRVGVEVLADRLHLHAVLPEQALEEHRFFLVAAEAVELVDEDGVDLVPAAVGDHRAEAGTLARRRVGGLALVHELADDAVVGPLDEPAGELLALGGDGEVLERLLVGGDAAVGDDVEHLRGLLKGSAAGPPRTLTAKRMPSVATCQGRGATSRIP